MFSVCVLNPLTATLNIKRDLLLFLKIFFKFNQIKYVFYKLKFINIKID